jgi:predicted RNA-binding Zn-ribbon protein involved in translation (DUF1610 family)
VSEALAPALQVATACPLCGGPLEMPEASSAAHCDHCGADLLVTGRRQVLSYEIPARIDARDAAARVRFTIPAADRRARAAAPRLLWVPYYRLTGEELCWRETVDRGERMARLLEVARDLRIEPGELLGNLSNDGAGDRQVEGRRLERSLLAVSGVPAAPSLGVRAQAVVLKLFDYDRASAAGVVLPPAISPAAARRRLLSPRDPETLVHREVLSAALAIVHVPIWMVEVSRSGAAGRVFLDGVSGAALAGPAAGEPLVVPAESSAPRAHRILGLRPLVCPNCAWSLPLRPDDVVFRCRACGRAWLAQAQHLYEVSQAVVAPPPDAAVARFLPVWELADRASGRTAYAPAFRCRRLRGLVDLAGRLVTRRPALRADDRADDEARDGDFVGCAIDRRDAIQLARFAAVGLVESGVRTADLRRPRARLLWLPFTHDGYAYCEAHTGASFPVRLLDLAA